MAIMVPIGHGWIYHSRMTSTSHDVAADDSSAPARFGVSGMHCAGCASGLQEALLALPEIDTAHVDFTSGITTVTGGAPAARVLEVIAGRGFTGEALSPGFDLREARSRLEQTQQEASRRWGRRALVGLGLWVPLEVVHWTLGGHGHGHAHGADWVPWFMLIGSAIVIAVAGGGFYASAWGALKRGGTNMDTLISIGATTAFVWSLVVFVMQRTLADPGAWAERPLYFAESAAVLGIISLGHWLEAKATARAGAAVRELLELQPDEAERIDSGGEVGTVPSGEVQRGDRLLIRPGGRVPVDGFIVDGRSDLDESLVTGEPIPVARGEGDPVVAGTVNGGGRLIIETTVDGMHTTVARVAELVRNAQSSQAPIQRLADRVSAIFVPSVLTIAAATLLLWGLLAGDWQTGVVSTVTVLIISCPCALGLATPMAVMVGAGEASRRGILVKSAASLEASGRLRRVVFDKTGTLTRGQPRVSSVELLPEAETLGLEERDLLRLAAGVEAASEHPIGRAIVQASLDRGDPAPVAEDFVSKPGEGVKAVVEGRRVEVVRDERVSCRILVDGRDVARVAVDDDPRADAKATIQRLRDLGLEVSMLTGDREDAAMRIGASIGLKPEEIVADATPASKLDVIKNAGSHTAMVGDGINDAAALAAAELGIAMAGGAGAAIESADVVVPPDRTEGVADAVHLARRTLTTIRQNLFLAFLYNTLAIPAAAFGLLGASGPLIAAGAMACSDVSVIGNAIRLRRSLAKERRRQTA